MRKGLVAAAAGALMFVAGPAWACGGLIAPNGAVNLGRTTTLAGYVNGVERYITGFSFAGAGGEFGSIVPLPDVPTKVEKAGEWTLQRLQIEVQPPELALAGGDAAAGARLESATVILEAKVDSLDVTVLEGGATAVGRWAEDHGFLLPPDSPEVLRFYARRSPIFMAVRFNAERAAEQGIAEGEATPVQVTIPTDDPWVPLRILSLGRQAEERVEADVFLLTERRPALLPLTDGLTLERSESASSSLLADLRSDERMEWVPTDGMWFSYLRLDSAAAVLTYDLAVDATGTGSPSVVDAGLASVDVDVPAVGPRLAWVLGGFGGMLALAAAVIGAARLRTAR